MKTLSESERLKIAAICRRYGVRYLDLFGSATEPGHFEPHRSDYDFVVEFENLSNTDAFRRFMGLKLDLEAALQRPVDLLIERAVKNPFLRKAIEHQRVRIYESHTGETFC
ncbi:MAG: nucleotidyltransferase domain-containing protein [Fimbriimonadales bacterium]|nr:nucleotidyltransferase domain-containing protein [Fimbriimonadales bacterium]